MKKNMIFLIMIVVIINLTYTYSFAENMYLENFIKVKLQKPIKSTNTINLQSEYGFTIYSYDTYFTELDKLQEQEIIITLGENDLLDIKDKNNNTLYSFGNSDNIYISSTDYNNSVLKIEEDKYRDFFMFNRVGNGIEVINCVSLNHYLYGVVPMEMPSSFPMEALKAQAIAARNFALSNMNKHILSGYNLCDSTDCQVYGGYDRETDNTNRAVDETIGIVIKYNGEIINATYHSNSGGYTENSENVWGGSVPYLKAVNDEFSNEAPNTDWQIVLSNGDIKTKLMKIGVNIGEISSIVPVNKTESGRVDSLKIIGTNGEHILEKNKIRQVLGYSDIKSNLFNIEAINGNNSFDGVEDVYVIDGKLGKPIKVNIKDLHVINDEEKRIQSSRGSNSRVLTNNGIEEIKHEVNITDKQFVIKGKGFGHGVGMSQWGARKMAELGYSYEEILKHYYNGVELTTEYR